MAAANLALGCSSMLVHAYVQRGLLRQPEVWASLVRQILFTGVQALPFAAVVAAALGNLRAHVALERGDVEARRHRPEASRAYCERALNVYGLMHPAMLILALHATLLPIKLWRGGRDAPPDALNHPSGCRRQ